MAGISRDPRNINSKIIKIQWEIQEKKKKRTEEIEFIGSG